jgi:hypothetical protein
MLGAIDALGRIVSDLKTARFSGDMQNPVSCSAGLSL